METMPGARQDAATGRRLSPIEAPQTTLKAVLGLDFAALREPVCKIADMVSETLPLPEDAAAAPLTFRLSVAAQPAATAVPGKGIVVAFVPASEGNPALVTMGCDPLDDPGVSIEQWLPAVVDHVFAALGRPAALRWVAIDRWGRFFEAVPAWAGSAEIGPPTVVLQRLAGGISVEAFVKEFGGVAEVALQMLSAVVDALAVEEDNPSARAFLDAVEYHNNLPAPGALFRKVEIAAASGDGKGLAALIQVDPVLSATVINYANAARFAGSAKTASVPQAVQRLGTDFVRRIVFIADMMARYRKGACASFDYAAYWRNAIATGAAMRGLMPIYEIDARMADDVFTTGLVSGIGWLAVAETFPGLMSRYVGQCADADPAAKAKLLRTAFPCPIRSVSSLFLTRYGFPEAIRAAVAGTAHGDDRNLLDCLAGGVRVAQALSPFQCLYEPPAPDIPDDCQLEWRRWQGLIDLAG
jgi:HD-like signal output (HDOD) protein